MAVGRQSGSPLLRGRRENRCGRAPRRIGPGHPDVRVRGRRLIGEEQGAVPEHVKRDIDATDVQPSTFEWAMGSLPTVCKITVTGGAAVAATLVATGPTGIALNVVMGMLGDDLSEWLTNRCCELAANSVTDVQSAICDTDSKALESDSG